MSFVYVQTSDAERVPAFAYYRDKDALEPTVVWGDAASTQCKEVRTALGIKPSLPPIEDVPVIPMSLGYAGIVKVLYEDL